MTRKDALKNYKNLFPNWDVSVKTDRVRVRCGWIDYIDSLQKNGEITERQAEKWGGILPL